MPQEKRPHRMSWRRLLTFGVAALVAAPACGGCSSPSTALGAAQNLAACNTAFRTVGPTVPTVVVPAAASSLLNALAAANNPRLVSFAAQLRAAVRAADHQKVLAVAESIAAFCQQNGVGTPVT